MLGPNPLFSGGVRDQSLIVVAGFVGVPKGLVQDGDEPKVLGAADWGKIHSPDLDKRDPHMIESIGPRPGLPRFTGDRAVDVVHGGDRDLTDGDDLQYACIAPRATDATGALDCAGLGADAAVKNPLCQSSTQQSHRKAYPGLRHLRILEALGASAFVASICNESFSPAVEALGRRLRSRLTAACSRQILPQDETGNVGCLVVEVFEGTFPGKRCETLTGAGPGTGYCTPGSRPCRRPGDLDYAPVDVSIAADQLTFPVTVGGKSEVVRATVDGGNVVAKTPDGKVHLVCEHRPLTGGRVDPATTKSCLEDPAFELSSGGGFCYSTVDAIVGDCKKSGAASTLRFLGDSVPKRGSQVFSVCR